MGRPHHLSTLLIAIASLALWPEPVAATHQCHYAEKTVIEGGKPTVELVKTCPPHQVSNTGSTTEEDTASAPTCTDVLEQLGYETENIQCGHHIYLETDEPAAPQLTPGRIRRALDSFEIPAPAMQIQPPNGRTLVNFDTNFYTEADVLHRDTTLLGQAIEFRIIPQSYTWTFGDGERRTTATPGAAYPDLEVTHRYRTKGTYSAQLSTTYTAEYRLNGGSWAPVPGDLTVTDEPRSLEATTAKPILVAPDGGRD